MFPTVNYVSRLGAHAFSGTTADPDTHLCECGTRWRDVYDGRAPMRCRPQAGGAVRLNEAAVAEIRKVLGGGDG